MFSRTGLNLNKLLITGIFGISRRSIVPRIVQIGAGMWTQLDAVVSLYFTSENPSC